jgi:pyruvate dehydrogenase E2 component (dihydrolipoamide acetyltransferase)
VGLTLEADATELVAWRQRLNREGHNVSYDELLAMLAARALQEFPYMNSQLVDGGVRDMPDINVGMAVDTERGLLVPVIRQANKKGVLEIHRTFSELLERARNGRSTVEDLSDGTFTISNLGMFEIEEFLPIVNFPECAILGVGAIVEKTVVVDGAVGIRPRVALTLSFDHRLVDGAPAARFLQRIKHLISDPLRLLS